MAENQENTPDKTDGERKVQQLNIELSHSGHIAQNEIFFQKDKLKRSLSADHIALQVRGIVGRIEPSTAFTLEKLDCSQNGRRKKLTKNSRKSLKTLKENELSKGHMISL